MYYMFHPKPSQYDLINLNVFINIQYESESISNWSMAIFVSLISFHIFHSIRYLI